MLNAVSVEMEARNKRDAQKAPAASEEEDDELLGMGNIFGDSEEEKELDGSCSSQESTYDMADLFRGEDDGLDEFYI